MSQTSKSVLDGLKSVGGIAAKKTTLMKLTSQFKAAKQAIGKAAHEQRIACGAASQEVAQAHAALEAAKQRITTAKEAMKSASGVKQKAVSAKDFATAEAALKMAEMKVSSAHEALGGFILANNVQVPGAEQNIDSARKLQEKIDGLNAEVGKLGHGLLKNKVGIAAVACVVLIIAGVGVVTLRGLVDGSDKPGATTAQVGPDAYCDRAFAYQENGQFEKAIELLDEALKLFPQHLAAYGMRGDIFLATGDCDKAIASYTEVIRLDPGGGFAYDAYNKRAIAYRNRGDLENAIRDFTQAILIQPDSPNSLDMRARCYGDLGQLDKALADLDAAIRIEPDSSIFHSDRGLVYYRKGNYEQALACLIEAVRLDPIHPDILGKRGMIYRKLGDVARAEEDFAMAARLQQQIANLDGDHSQESQSRKRPTRQPSQPASAGGWSDPNAPSAWNDAAAAEEFIREGQASRSPPADAKGKKVGSAKSENASSGDIDISYANGYKNGVSFAKGALDYPGPVSANTKKHLLDGCQEKLEGEERYLRELMNKLGPKAAVTQQQQGVVQGMRDVMSRF